MSIRQICGAPVRFEVKTIWRPLESAVAVENAFAEGQLPGFLHVAIRRQPQVQNKFLLPHDQHPPVSRKTEPEITFEVVGQAMSFTIRISNHPQLRIWLVGCARRDV